MFLSDLLVVFAVATAVVFAFGQARVPSVVGLLVAGVLVGPYGLSLVSDVKVVELLAEIGVVVLLFTVGLEFSMSRLVAMLPLMARIGLPQVVGTTVLVAVATWWYLGTLPQAIFAGLLVAMSSTAIVLKLLADRSETAAPHGRITVAVLLLQDLLVVAAMLAVPALAAAVDCGAARRLLDVGGGSGVYAIALAERFEALAATVLEAAPVDAIARRTIRTAGLDDRIAVVTADMFTGPWPADHDVHLFSNVLHDWDEDDCRRLLDKSAQALAPGGRILVHDMLLDDDKAGPLWAAEYSVLLSTVTQGRLYSAAEIGGWLAERGFTIVAHAPTALGRSVLSAVKDPAMRAGHSQRPA